MIILKTTTTEALIEGSFCFTRHVFSLWTKIISTAKEKKSDKIFPWLQYGIVDSNPQPSCLNRSPKLTKLPLGIGFNWRVADKKSIGGCLCLVLLGGYKCKGHMWPLTYLGCPSVSCWIGWSWAIGMHLIGRLQPLNRGRWMLVDLSTNLKLFEKSLFILLQSNLLLLFLLFDPMMIFGCWVC